MFWNKFISECNRKGVKPTVAVVEMGFQKSVATRWKKGGKPTDINIQKCADYFGISFEEMKYGTELNPTAEERKESIEGTKTLSDREEKLLELFRSLTEEQQDLILSLYKI